jgi:hypothetical protein
MIDEVTKLIIIGCAGALTIIYPTIYGIHLIRKDHENYDADSEDAVP